MLCLPSLECSFSSFHSPAGPCQAAPTVCTMILKVGGGGRGWSQVSWTSKSPLGSRKSRYVQFECVCAPMWEVCHSVRGGVPLWDGVSHCGTVCPIVGRCVGCVCVCVHVCVCVSLPRVLTVAELMIDIAFPISTS